MSYPVRLKFEKEKFVSSVAFLAAHIENLDKLKAAKLLYFADKYHLLKYGRPIMGDVYYRLDYGPVPSKALDIMNEVIQDRKMDFPQPNLQLFREYLKIDADKRYPTIELKKKVSDYLEYLSESEKEALQDTIEKFGKYSGAQLIKLSHKESPWLKTSENDEIDYRLFFEDAESDPAALEYFEQSFREQSEIVFLLTSPY